MYILQYTVHVSFCEVQEYIVEYTYFEKSTRINSHDIPVVPDIQLLIRGVAMMVFRLIVRTVIIFKLVQ